MVSERGGASLVYCDETGFDRHTYRPYAYARRGEKIYGERSGNRRPRTGLILARQNGKLLAPMLFSGTANAELVNAWMKQELIPRLRPHSTIILDNAAFHKKADLEAIAKPHGHHILFLPPYSPDFNPIEKTFANIKKYRQNAPQDASIDAIIKSYGNYLE